MSNAEIIELLRTGRNTEALKELYAGYPAVRHFIKTHGGNEDDARDVFQESLVVLFKNAQKSDFQLSAAVSTYLFSVCRFMWKDALKKKNREVKFITEDIADEELNLHLEEEEQIRWLDKIVGSLGEKCSEILRLFYYGKLSMEEIASKLGYRNVDTAKTQKYKCIERARTMANEMSVTNHK